MSTGILLAVCLLFLAPSGPRILRWDTPERIQELRRQSEEEAFSRSLIYGREVLGILPVICPDPAKWNGLDELGKERWHRYWRSQSFECRGKLYPEKLCGYNLFPGTDRCYYEGKRSTF